jgi:uncharacterized protein
MEKEVSFYSLDGLRLDGTFRNVEPNHGVAVLVHGGGVDRNEVGFYQRFATYLSENGYASLRFDWRGAGSSEGELADVTLSGIANDILVAIAAARSYTRHDAVHLVGTSFGGGPTVMISRNNESEVKSLCLFNPVLNYRARLLEEKKNFWSNESGLDPSSRERLNKDGYLLHGSSIKMARPLINEVCYVSPYLLMADLRVPTLLAHGKSDNLVRFDMSVAYHHTAGPNRFIAIDGADHGFSWPGDDDYTHPQTLKWQAEVFQKAVSWMSATQGSRWLSAEPL